MSFTASYTSARANLNPPFSTGSFECYQSFLLFIFKSFEMRISFIVTALYVSLTFSTTAQQVKVLDKSDLQPISQVNITNTSKTTMVVSDAQGIADISGFNESDSLFFTHVTFQSFRTTKPKLAVQNYTVYLTENIIRLDEFVISANKVEEKKSDLPYKIEVIQAKDIAFDNPATSAVMLEQTGEVFVQQSQLGGGSPVLRGFEANRVLMVIDGVRMNNAIYRKGHLQSAITVDPFGLATTEILYGPGATIYGSDAIGGVITFNTLDPLLSSTGKIQVHGNLLARYASSNNETTGGANVNVGWKKWAFLLNFSYSHFYDLREGRLRNPAYGDWGTRPFYAERIDGEDTMMVNSKPWIQKPSAYSQYNVLGKILYQPGIHSKYLLNIQYSNSSDIPRYDRLTEMNSSTGKLKYAEWYYGPQMRLLTSLKAEYNLNAVIFDHASFIVAYQKVNEDRINRTFGKSWKKFNLETVDVISVNADFDKRFGSKDNLRYGIEFDYNDVHSNAHQENINTDAITYDLGTRYPDQKGNMMTLAAYVSNNWNISKSFAFSQGVRFNYITLNAAYTDAMMKIMKFPFDKNIAQKNTAVTGFLGLTVTPGHDWKISLIGSTGFRAPNIDDLTKLNESNSADKTIIVPNPDLNPEYAWNAEISVGKTIFGKIRLEGTVFYTRLQQAIVVGPSQFNGKDSIEYNDVVCKVMTSTNAGSAYVYGFQGNLLAQVTRSFSIVSNLTYTVGRVNNPDNEPLDHIPPVFGMTSFRLELKKFKGDFYIMYNGWKRISDYSSSGEDNQAYATPYGMPSWYTLNLKLSYQIDRYLCVEAGVENILNEHYRKFASGISSPGRNFILALRATL